MNRKTSSHTFHIPVMGTGFTIDTPIKVAQYGIDSVISIIDHKLTERMREYYCRKWDITFTPIDESEHDCRARRITAYLNLVQDIVDEKFEELKHTSFTAGSAITKYFEMLPDSSSLKREYSEMLGSDQRDIKEKQNVLREKIAQGALDVNIMTKLDKVNYSKEALPAEYNDAHAALRGFAESKLSSSVVFSAGMNPRLYGYIAHFDDFFPDEDGMLRKKVTLKVSDYRSALIQGKFLAKKGIWVSEFRIESGLNCGGHAFATDGFLMGPILEEFKLQREDLIAALFEQYSSALEKERSTTISEPLPLRITAQGGVGTSQEHEFIRDHYQLDSVGWGSPFLLVPDVVNMDNETLALLSNAGEEDLYLSNISPLGVPFNTVKGSTIEIERRRRIESGKPGSPCLNDYLTFSKEFTERPLCIASRKYQRRKIKELEAMVVPAEEYNTLYEQIVEKSCICSGLGNTALLTHDMEPHRTTPGISVCPGPNLAYFSKVLTLEGMLAHLYGRTDVIQATNRPNMFIKEINMYLDYFKKKIESSALDITARQVKYLGVFHENLEKGLLYYKSIFPKIQAHFGELESRFLRDLRLLQLKLEEMQVSVQTIRIQYDEAECRGVPSI